MSPRRVLTIYWRDLREAIRDGRILIAVLLPIALAIYYSVALPDPTERFDALLLVDGPRTAQFVSDVEQRVEGSVDVTIEAAGSTSAARAAIKDEDAVLLAMPDDVDAAIDEGRQPDVTVTSSDATGAGASILLGAISEVATVDPDAKPRVQVDVKTIGSDEGGDGTFELLGTDTWFGVLSVLMLAAMIAFLAVPVLLMEEVTLGTLDALQLVATTSEVIIAKLLVGLTYCGVAIAIIIPAANLQLEDPVLFVGAALVLSLALSGFGLALGLALGDPGRVNTWSGVILLPLLVPGVIALSERASWHLAVDLFPTGAGTLLLAHAADPAAVPFEVAPTVALVAWTVAGFVLLWRLLDRREA